MVNLLSEFINRNRQFQEIRNSKSSADFAPHFAATAKERGRERSSDACLPGHFRVRRVNPRCLFSRRLWSDTARRVRQARQHWRC